MLPNCLVIQSGKNVQQFTKTWCKDKINIFIYLSFTDYFLEDPSNIECIEGEDATLTCKVRFENQPVNWLKDDKEITFNENCTMSKQGTKYNLILKKVKPEDSGEYCMQVGKISRKIQLKIIGIECIKHDKKLLLNNIF